MVLCHPLISTKDYIRISQGSGISFRANQDIWFSIYQASWNLLINLLDKNKQKCRANAWIPFNPKFYLAFEVRSVMTEKAIWHLLGIICYRTTSMLDSHFPKLYNFQGYHPDRRTPQCPILVIRLYIGKDENLKETDIKFTHTFKKGCHSNFAGRYVFLNLSKFSIQNTFASPSKVLYQEYFKTCFQIPFESILSKLSKTLWL